MKSDDVKDLFEKYVRIENEIKLLQEDKKATLAEFKDRVSPKAFKVALGVTRAKAKLKPHESSTFDQILALLENQMSFEFENVE